MSHSVCLMQGKRSYFDGEARDFFQKTLESNISFPQRLTNQKFWFSLSDISRVLMVVETTMGVLFNPKNACGHLTPQPWCFQKFVF